MTGGINYILFILGILSDDTRWKLLTRSLNVIYSLADTGFFRAKTSLNSSTENATSLVTDGNLWRHNSTWKKHFLTEAIPPVRYKHFTSCRNGHFSWYDGFDDYVLNSCH